MSHKRKSRQPFTMYHEPGAVLDLVHQDETRTGFTEIAYAAFPEDVANPYETKHRIISIVTHKGTGISGVALRASDVNEVVYDATEDCKRRVALYLQAKQAAEYEQGRSTTQSIINFNIFVSCQTTYPSPSCIC